MKITPHLTFAGNCRQAFAHYQSLFGGELACFSYAESPAKDSVPEHWQEKLVHASLGAELCSLSGVDLQPEEFQPPQGVYMLVETNDEHEARRVFAGLADGGSVQMDIQKTFWSPLYGSVTDRFGISWEINYVVDKQS